VIFSYLNPILRYGLRRFADDAAAAGVDGVLAIDMIIEEAGEYLAQLARVNLAPVFLAAPTSPDARLDAIAKNTKGFVYAISRVGVTGTQQSVANDAKALVERIRRWTKLPVAVGFGISNAEHVAQVAEFADAAVIGSAIVELIEKSTAETAPGEVSRFIKGLRLRDAALAR
jgi:tryptophan synthase alpha chain